VTAAVLAVAILTLAGVALGGLPRVRMNRATIALVGATAVVLLGGISPESAKAAVDLDTLFLLFGMMVINANLRLAGGIDLLAARMLRVAHSPRQLVGVIVLAAGLLSALLLNDTVVLVFTPLVLDVALAAGLPPVPLLVALGTAANVGSAATPIGNPQNMLVGMSSGISFTRFAAALGPPALAGLAITWAAVLLLYRRQLGTRAIATQPPRAMRVHRPLLRKSLFALAVLLAALFAGAPPALAALGSASLLLVTRRLKPERVFREVDWALLVFFAGLFVVTAAVEEVGRTHGVLDRLAAEAGSSLGGLVVVSAALSNIVSNVPAVLLLRPLVGALADPDRAWLALALATTFAGNLTLLGSVANLIVAESAARRGVRLSFGEFLRAGVPITVLTLALGWAWLSALP
jgi:Na+/H+ antiporter NhaD/arsenite permease-like protein